MHTSTVRVMSVPLVLHSSVKLGRLRQYNVGMRLYAFAYHLSVIAAPLA